MVGKYIIEIGTLIKSVTVVTNESKVVAFDDMDIPEGDYEIGIDGLSFQFECT